MDCISQPVMTMQIDLYDLPAIAEVQTTYDEVISNVSKSLLFKTRNSQFYAIYQD